MATKTSIKPTSVVTLRGSAQIVAEFFGTYDYQTYLIFVPVPYLSNSLSLPPPNLTLSPPSTLPRLPAPLRAALRRPARAGYSINSILYQRGLFDPDSFKVVKKYGLQMQILTDEGVSAYLKQALRQICGTVPDETKKSR